eukprot:58287_1
MSEVLLNSQKITVLVDGYCKMNTYNHNIPMMLIKLISAFYNEIYHWIFKDNKLKQFLSAPYAKYIINKPITINNMKFQFLIYSKRTGVDSYKTYFAAQAIHIPDEIDFVTTVVSFYHKQCNYFNTSTYTFKNCKQHIRFRIANPTIFTDKNEIDYYGKLEILRIQPKDLQKHKSLFYHKEGIFMHKNVDFEWIIDGDLLARITADSNDYTMEKCYRSNYFDGNNWILKLHKKLDLCDDDSYRIRLCLCQLAKDIKQFAFKCEIKVKQNDYLIAEKITKRKRDYTNVVNSIGMAIKLNKDVLLKTKCINVSVHINITEVIAYNDQVIEPDQWSNYGILSD